jgi:hypothetical protein
MEAPFIKQQKLSLEQTVTALACMHRKQRAILPTLLDWNMRSPVDA